MRSLLFSVTALVAVLLVSGSWTGGFRRLNRAESEELNEICGKTLTWQYPRRSVQRISHGTAAKQGELPWAVRLMIRRGKKMSVCSASIISKYHIITAAHCFMKNNSFIHVFSADTKGPFLLGGSSCAYLYPSEKAACKGSAHEQPKKVRISKIIVPESSLTWRYTKEYGQVRCTPDIAIVELENPISYMNDQMVPICVPSYITSPPVEYTQYGFGITENTNDTMRLYKLRQSKRQLLNYELPPSTDKPNIPLCKKMVAVLHSEKRSQTCLGDSGGGLSGMSSEKHYLFGVFSSLNHKFCGLPNEVKDVVSYYTWFIPYNDFLCFYTGVCPLGYNVYMDRYYAWHPEAAILFSGGNFATWLNKGYFGIYKRIEAPEAYEKVYN